MRIPGSAAYAALPTPLRVALPVALFVAIAGAAWLATRSSDSGTEQVLATRDVAVLRAARRILEDEDVEATADRRDDTFILSVPADAATQAAETLAAAGVRDLTIDVEDVRCPKATGIMATPSEKAVRANCLKERKIQRKLVLAGAVAADVSVESQTSESPLGPDQHPVVTAQVFLPDRLRDSWDVVAMEQAIAGTAATTTEYVTITDETWHRLDPVDDADSGDAPASTSSLGCDDIADATEIETKKAAVRECYRARIAADLETVLGGARYVLSVEPSIRSEASTTSSIERDSEVDAGSAAGDDADAGSDPSTVDGTTTERTSALPAGMVTAVRISVTLDRAAVDPAVVAAVREIVRPYATAHVASPAVRVTLASFAARGGAGTARRAGGADAAPPAAAGRDAEADATGTALETDADAPTDAARTRGDDVRIPTPLLAAALAAIAAIAIAGALLMRRRERSIRVERERLERSFRSEQRLFEDFAQQHPDALARELEALFGAPSATPPVRDFSSG